MSKSKRKPSRPDENMNMADVVEIVLIKADGEVITNEPRKITIEFLEGIVNELDADRQSTKSTGTL